MKDSCIKFLAIPIGIGFRDGELEIAMGQFDRDQLNPTHFSVYDGFIIGNAP